MQDRVNLQVPDGITRANKIQKNEQFDATFSNLKPAYTYEFEVVTILKNSNVLGEAAKITIALPPWNDDICLM